MKLLITGGNGFIARNLFELFSGEHQVVTCDRQALDLLDSTAVFKNIRDNGYDVVIHAATYDPTPRGSVKDPSKVLENNLAMFFNIARCGGYFGKMIYFGSGAEYDRRYWGPAMKEEYFDAHVPLDQYGFSKYIMTKYAQANDSIYNLRIFSVFGKYEDWRYRFISRACCQAVLDMPITIGRNAAYDFLYIDDLAKIIRWFMKNDPQKKVYNVCAGQVYDFNDLAGVVRKVSGKALDIIIKVDEPAVEYGGDNSLLLNEMKNVELSPIERSIDDLYRWYVSNRQRIDRKELQQGDERS